MTTLEIEEEIYNFLHSHNILLSQGQRIGNNKYLIGPPTTNYLENGILFGKLAISISKSMGKRVIFSNLDSLKNFNTSSARIFNWNIVVEAFQKININIDNDFKNFLSSGDTSMIVELIKEIYNSVNSKGNNTSNTQNLNEEGKVEIYFSFF